MALLTSQLASSSPEAFRQELVTGLSRRSVYGKQLWDAVASAGYISLGALHIESKSWVSRSNAQQHYIHLGAVALPADIRKRLIFDDQKVGYEQEISLRLLHELGHLFEASRIDAGSDRIQDLLITARTVRNVNQNLGLTAIGSLPFYEPAIKFHEDSAELMAMYAFDPDYLHRFLAYVDSPGNASTLNEVGIAVAPRYGNELFKLVEGAVLEGISV